MSEFVEFTKIGRLSREIIITEKIDGTNGVIEIGEDGSFQIGSRSRWLGADGDNFGFGMWALMHKDELIAGPWRWASLRRMVGRRHSAPLRPQGKTLVAVQCVAVGREAPGVLPCRAGTLAWRLRHPSDLRDHAATFAKRQRRRAGLHASRRRRDLSRAGERAVQKDVRE